MCLLLLWYWREPKYCHHEAVFGDTDFKLFIRKLWPLTPFPAQEIQTEIPAVGRETWLHHLKNLYERETQELKSLAVVTVGRLKWLMHVESCYSRNRNTWPMWLQKVNKHFEPLCPRGLQVIKQDGIWDCVQEWKHQMKNYRTADKEILGKSWLKCNSYLINLFPKPLTYPFLILIKS